MAERKISPLVDAIVCARLNGRAIQSRGLFDAEVKTEEDVYRVHSLLDQDGRLGQLIGWKVGFTNGAFKKFDLSEPAYGPLFASGLYASGAPLDMAYLRATVIEAEVAFVIGRDLPQIGKDRTQAEVLAAVSHVLPALEIVGSRIDFDLEGAGLHRVADGALNAAVVLGDRLSPEKLGIHVFENLGDLEVKLSCNSVVIAEGKGSSGSVETPSGSLAWLANGLNRRGAMLRAGQVVITGAAALTRSFEPGDSLRADFGALGIVTAEVAHAGNRSRM